MKFQGQQLMKAIKIVQFMKFKKTVVVCCIFNNNKTYFSKLLKWGSLSEFVETAGIHLFRFY